MKNFLIITPLKDKIWYKNNLIHKEDGAAIEGIDGTKEWYINGKLHREDGPAIECDNGDKCWFLNGICYETEEAFNSALKRLKNKRLKDKGSK